MYVWEGSNYALLAVSLSCMTTKFIHSETMPFDQNIFTATNDLNKKWKCTDIE